MKLENHCLCFNFEPNGDNFYIIDSKLMKFLVEKLEVDYKEIDWKYLSPFVEYRYRIRYNIIYIYHIYKRIKRWI